MQEAQGGLLTVSADTCHDGSVKQRDSHKTMLFVPVTRGFGDLSLLHDAAGRAQQQQSSADASP